MSLVGNLFMKKKYYCFKRGGKNITLEPGNQIELSGDTA